MYYELDKETQLDFIANSGISWKYKFDNGWVNWVDINKKWSRFMSSTKKFR